MEKSLNNKLRNIVNEGYYKIYSINIFKNHKNSNPDINILNKNHFDDYSYLVVLHECNGRYKKPIIIKAPPKLVLKMYNILGKKTFYNTKIRVRYNKYGYYIKPKDCDDEVCFDIFWGIQNKMYDVKTLELAKTDHIPRTKEEIEKK